MEFDVAVLGGGPGGYTAAFPTSNHLGVWEDSANFSR